MRFLFRFGVSVVDGSAFFAISPSNSLQKSSAIQKISVTLLSVIMIQYLLFVTSKLLNISDITKKIGSLKKLPIQLFYGVPYPELAFIEYGVYYLYKIKFGGISSFCNRKIGHYFSFYCIFVEYSVFWHWYGILECGNYNIVRPLRNALYFYYFTVLLTSRNKFEQLHFTESRLAGFIYFFVPSL
jgi:hypothetical protein